LRPLNPSLPANGERERTECAVPYLTPPASRPGPPAKIAVLAAKPRAGMRTIFYASATAVAMRPCCLRIESVRSADAGSTT
jgi:hypothetical protein